MTDRYTLHALAAFAGCYLLGFVFKKVALTYRILDTPDERKQHAGPTPLLGGAAVFGGMCIGVLLSPGTATVFLLLIAGGAGMLVLNLIDDMAGLPARHRVTVEVMLAVLMVVLGVRISFLPPGWLGTLGEAVITVLWFVGIANAVNYLDGLDGLAAGLIAISSFFFAMGLLMLGQTHLAILCLALMGSCLGFLPHNMAGTKMFLGDAGSTFIGFMIAGIAVAGDWAGTSSLQLFIPVIILGIPIFDMTLTTVQRVRSGKVGTVVEWMKYAGRDHVHHRLMDRGFSPFGATVVIWTISAALGLGALLLL